MKPEKFVEEYYPFAKQTQDKTGISAIAVLAQAALESGWGDKAPGNMFFGVKDTDGKNGNEQLLTTTEYHDSIDVRYPEVISITPCMVRGKKRFRYKVKDWFRKYDTPEQSFTDHTTFFFFNRRYAKAVACGHNCHEFIAEIAAAGYATDPNYADSLHSIARKIEGILNAKLIPAA